MKTLNFFMAFLFVFIGLISASAQTSTTSDPRDTRPDYMRNVDAGRARQNEQVKKVVERSHSLGGSPGRPPSPEERRSAELKKRRALAEINALLSAPAEYYSKHAEFLKRKNTGLMRVFPDRGCDKGMVVSVRSLERCGLTAPIRGAGSLFSFRLDKIPSFLDLPSIHRLIGLSDIHFINGKFIVGTESILDIISDVGQVDLADVTLKSDSVKFLKAFELGEDVAEVALQKQNLSKGVEESGFLYSTSATIKPNQTYLLRSIAYRTSIYKSFWNTDVLTAFKVVGQANDGSVVILWKELKESSAPYVRK